jgi:PQ loop repeat.
VTLANLSGSIAALLSVVFIWPQVIRVYAKQSVEGVTGLSHLIGLSGTLMWFTYAINTQSLPMMVSNANIEIAIVALMVMLVRKRVLPLWLPVTVFIGSVVYCVVLNAVAPSAVGITGVLIGTPAIVPQVWRAVRTEYLLGISASSYLLLASMSLGWFTHGVLINDAILTYPNFLLAPSALFIAWKAWSSQRRAAQMSVS